MPLSFWPILNLEFVFTCPFFVKMFASVVFSPGSGVEMVPLGVSLEVTLPCQSNASHGSLNWKYYVFLASTPSIFIPFPLCFCLFHFVPLRCFCMFAVTLPGCTVIVFALLVQNLFLSLLLFLSIISLFYLCI